MVNNNNEITIFNNQQLIEKANYLVITNIDKQLTFRQLKLLSYAIFRMPIDSMTSEFKKSELQDFLEVTKYHNTEFANDRDMLLDIKFRVEDKDFSGTDNGGFADAAVLFKRISYDNNFIKCYFNDELKVGLKNLAVRYMTLDLSMMRKMSRVYSWILYEELKRNYGSKYNVNKTIEKTPEEIIELFKLENNPSYNSNFGDVNRKILDKACEEINKFTEINVEKELIRSGRGRKITKVRFSWTVSDIEYGITKKQEEYYLKRSKELLSRPEFTENPEYSIYVEMYKTLDYSSLTKDKMKQIIKKTDEIIQTLNKKINENEVVSHFDLESSETIEQIKDRMFELMKEEGLPISFVEFYGDVQFEDAFEVAKLNMVHPNSVESIAKYVSKTIIDSVQREKK
ncbi:TPA: replication initiation protein [Streptococcus agalactiae]